MSFMFQVKGWFKTNKDPILQSEELKSNAIQQDPLSRLIDKKNR